MPNAIRYELSEGNSNKFWEIRLSDNSFTTTYGKIGSNGQTTIKSFGSAAEAKKEHDKLIAEKVKKGYAQVGGQAAAASPKPATPAPSPLPSPPEEAKKASAKEEKNVAGASGSTGARRFEFVEGSSSKFWEVAVAGAAMTTTWGKIGGSSCSSKTKTFASDSAAQAEAAKLVAEKTRKGYVEKT